LLTRRWKIAASGIGLACLVAVGVALRRDIPARMVVATSQAVSQEPGRVESQDDLFVRVEEGAPGFGGMFIGADGRLAVYLVDPATVAAARAAIEEVFGADRVPTAGIRALQGQFTISELKAWTESARGVFEHADVTLIDLDEAKNRVTIGVADDSQVNAVERAISSLGIPREAVIIEPLQRIRPMAPR
jgi:hypothetical protein